MIQIRIEITEQEKGGRVSIESKVAVCKQTVLTKGEAKVAGKMKALIEILMKDLAGELPEASLAMSPEDVETLKGIEQMNSKKENDDDEGRKRTE
jgi:hypothetical protein